MLLNFLLGGIENSRRYNEFLVANFSWISRCNVDLYNLYCVNEMDCGGDGLAVDSRRAGAALVL